MAGAWVALSTAIRTAALADIGAGGLFQTGVPMVTGLFSVKAPQNQPYPYIVLQQVSEPNSDTFNTEGGDITFEFAIYGKEYTATVATVDAIAERLKVLFRKKTLTITGWSTASVHRQAGYNFIIADEVIQKNEEYKAVFAR